MASQPVRVVSNDAQVGVSKAVKREHRCHSVGQRGKNGVQRRLCHTEFKEGFDHHVISLIGVSRRRRCTTYSDRRQRNQRFERQALFEIRGDQSKFVQVWRSKPVWSSPAVQARCDLHQVVQIGSAHGGWAEAQPGGETAQHGSTGFAPAGTMYSRSCAQPALGLNARARVGSKEVKYIMQGNLHPAEDLEIQQPPIAVPTDDVAWPEVPMLELPGERGASAKATVMGSRVPGATPSRRRVAMSSAASAIAVIVGCGPRRSGNSAAARSLTNDTLSRMD